jgi:hypothetical protein
VPPAADEARASLVPEALVARPWRTATTTRQAHQACLREHALAPDLVYLRAASHALGRSPEP